MTIHGKQLTNTSVAPGKCDLSVTWGFTTPPQSTADPSSANDLARRAWIESQIAGMRDFKDSVLFATVAALPACTAAGVGVGKTLTGDANGALSVDGVAVGAGNRILVKNQVAAKDNGIYTVTQPGTAGTPFILTRATDADSNPEVTPGMYMYVELGSTLNTSAWVCNNSTAIDIDVDAINFAQYSGLGQITAGAGLTKTGNTLDVGAVNGITANADNIEVIYAAPSVAADAAAASAGVANSAMRSDAKIDVAVGSPVDVGQTNSDGVLDTLARADHIHHAPTLTIANKEQTPVATSGDDEDTTLTITETPAIGSYVRVFVNGISYILGNGVKTKDCYFTNDAGVTARAINAIFAGDAFYWNGTIAGFDLSVADRIDFDYLSFGA